MHHRRRLLPLVLASLAVLPVAARAAEEPAKPGDTITWVKTLPPAFEQAEKEKKPLMICINSERVDGGRREPAAKELRDVTYRDPRVVTKSRLFVCAFLTSEGSSDDFGELRARFKMEGLIVSPQHIFVKADGQTILKREEYWPYGTGDQSVTALLKMMDQALASDKAAALPANPAPAPGGPAPAPGAPGAPPAPGAAPAPVAPPPGNADEQAKWLAEMCKTIVDGPAENRREALRRLLTDDKDGTFLKAILAQIPALVTAKDLPAQLDVVRALGRPGLKDAVPAVSEYLDHKDEELRGNAAVTLEYIGAPEAVDELKKRLGHEKSELVECHVLRGIGRCGAGDSKVRALLDRQVTSGRSEALSCAAIIGLAYFEKDKDAARALEQHLDKAGIPGGGGRGGRGGGNQIKRAVLAWALAEVGDPKSAEFMRKEMLPKLDNNQAFWVPLVRTYWVAVAEVCEGDAGKKGAVDEGVRATISYAGGNPLMDDARKNRDGGGFTPKGDWDVQGRGGAPGGNPPGKPGGN
jgi:hypothetical protein